MEGEQDFYGLISSSGYGAIHLYSLVIHMGPAPKNVSDVGKMEDVLKTVQSVLPLSKQKTSGNHWQAQGE